MISIVTIKDTPKTDEAACARWFSKVDVAVEFAAAGIQLYRYQNKAREIQITE